MTIEEIIARLDHFSTKELEKLAHEIRVILEVRDGNYVVSFQRKRRRPMDPLVKLVQEAEDWLEFAKHHEVSDDTLYWATKILIARDKRREIERKMIVEQCVDEMICKFCGHELDCFYGIENLDRANRYATLESV